MAIVDAGGHLISVSAATGDEEVAALVPGDAALIVVDAPLRVPNAEGRRDLDRLLEWSDVPVFPASVTRLTKLHGGVRGPRLTGALPAGTPRAETPPDLMLRQLAWERRAAGRQPGLAEYRELFLAVRAPRHRPRGKGRADPREAAVAADLLTDALDLADWRPEPSADDRRAIVDAALLDAVAAAALAHRARTEPGRAIALASDAEGPYLLPSDGCFRERLTRNLERLREEGAVSLLEIPPTPGTDRH